MYQKQVILTKNGLEKMKENYEMLKERYRQVSRDLRQSIQDGDGRDPIVQIKSLEQEVLQGDIERLERLLATAKVVKNVTKAKLVRRGMRVRYEESGKGYDVTLVDPLEANPHEGYISVESPIGRALLGRKINETVSAHTPVGPKQLRIVKLG